MEPKLLKQMRGKALVDMKEGRKVGVFEDLLITPGEFRTAALITSRGMLLNRKMEGVSAEDVRVWGHDVILVDNPGVVRPREELRGLENTVLASNVLKGHSVVSVDGKRIGVVDDFYINDRGNVDGVRLSQVFADGPISRMKMIPITAIRSLGPDVIIVEMDRVIYAENESSEITPDYSRIMTDETETVDSDATIPTRRDYEMESSGAAIFATPERR